MTTTTDPKLRSFIVVSVDSHFPIQNLPYGVFRPSAGGAPRVGVAIGSYVLDLSILEARGLLPVPDAKGQHVFAQSSLNLFMSLGRGVWRDVRAAIWHLLEADVTTLRDDSRLRHESLFPMDQVEMLLPVQIGDYTDFYSSREHATNVGRLLRPSNPLLHNWLHMPVAYHGRVSSVVVSGTDVRRPLGQRLPDDAVRPVFGPSQAVDYELEIGYFIGQGNRLGEPIAVGRAWEHVFGLVLVNDWSARDVQKWEYQPLGPFLSKNFATSISPWVVPLEALEPFRTHGPNQDPPPLPYLQTPANDTFDIHLEVHLQTPTMPLPEPISRSNMRFLYWNIPQQVAHHTITGCNLRTGDLMATGTISGPTLESVGCLLEATHGGREPLRLPNGDQRRFLADGDRVTLTAWCDGDGYRVGFGAVTAELLPPHHGYADLH